MSDVCEKICVLQYKKHKISEKRVIYHILKEKENCRNFTNDNHRGFIVLSVGICYSENVFQATFFRLSKP